VAGTTEARCVAYMLTSFNCLDRLQQVEKKIEPCLCELGLYFHCFKHGEQHLNDSP